MRIAAFLIFAFVMAAKASAAAHLGLLSESEMAMVNHNAEITRKKFLPGQLISACWPYDARNGSLTGLAYCQVETPSFQSRELEILQGPDMFCSYLRESYCSMEAHKPSATP